MIKSIFLHDKFIIIVAVITGYSLWLFLAQYQTISIPCEAPLYFYNVSPESVIEAPEKVNLTLLMKRKYVYLHEQSYAIQIDASQLFHGTHSFYIREEQLELPKMITLIDAPKITFNYRLQ